MKRNKLYISLFVGLSSMLIAALSFSFAWFKTQMIKVTWGDMAGSILEQYFDRKEYGDFDPTKSAGSAENPFVITTPKHYENLVKLHHVVDDNGNTFGSKGFYFEIGKQFSTDGDYEVYGYDENGVSTGSKSQVLNLGGLHDLEPIGSSDNPFVSNLDGHNITVTNFTVSPDADSTSVYNDVGIFGFVGETASCKNTYWGNFTIDPKGAGVAEHEDTTVITPHEEDVRIGYLAGHIVNTSAFTNCYVNNCQIKSGTVDFKRVNMYGYYGLAERDVNSGSYGKGSSYQFTLDSKDIYNYFASSYSAIQNQPLVLRNTAEVGRGVGQPSGELDNTKFSNVVQNGTLNTYTLSSSDRVPSLSTIGYVSGPRTTQQYTNEIYYRNPNNSSQYLEIPSNAAFTDKKPEENADAGDYIRYDEDQDSWSYYHSENRLVKQDSDKMNLNISFKSASRYAYVLGSTSNRSLTGNLYITIPNGSGSNVLKTIPLKGSGVNGANITWSCNSVSVQDLPLGDYYISAEVNISYRHSFIVSTNYSYNYIIAGTRTAINETNPTQYQLTPVLYNTNYLLRENGTIDGFIEIDLAPISNTNGNIDSFPQVKNSTPYNPIANTYILTCEKTFETILYQLYEGNYTQIIGDDDVSYRDAIIEYDGDKWIITYYRTVLDQTNITNHFVADEDEIRHGDEPGYRADNLDVVGPGVYFYRAQGNFFINYDIRVIRMPSETSTTKYVNAITASDIGQPFYSTTYALNSIVLYIKNVYNAAAKRNEDIGDIEFRYAKIGGINLVTPQFRKGSGVYADLNSVGDDPTTSQGNMEEIISVTLKENAVQAACYCCLDRNGNILGTFNADGSLGVGLTNDNLKDIYTYVMVIGGYGNAATWVTRVDFDFTAEDGYGGNFGSVGYRSSPDTIVSTILNFYLEVENYNLAFCVKVDYLDGVYDITLSCNAQMIINVYNYDSANYTVNLNGEPAARNNTVAANGYTYPADAQI